MVEVERTYNMQKYKILKQIMQNMSYKKEFFKDLSKCDYIFLHCKYKGKHKLFFYKTSLRLYKDNKIPKTMHSFFFMVKRKIASVYAPQHIRT